MYLAKGTAKRIRGTYLCAYFLGIRIFIDYFFESHGQKELNSIKTRSHVT
jgi:hypothetical protein